MDRWGIPRILYDDSHLYDIGDSYVFYNTREGPSVNDIPSLDSYDNDSIDRYD